MNSLRIVLLLLFAGCASIRCQIVLNVAGRGRSKHASKKEDYTFGAKLKRATEECSYIARKDDDSDRKEAVQRIKNEMNNRNVKEFYREKEEERKRGKEYYEKIERQIRNKVSVGGHLDFSPGKTGSDGRLRPGHRHGGGSAPLPAPRWPNVPAMLSPRTPGGGFPPPAGELFYPFPTTSFGTAPHRDSPDGGIHRIFRRSRRTQVRDPSFREGKFKDHNNCFSRCVFARMELVDALGFPQESILRKTFEDLIDNRKVRQAKIKKAFSCFDEVKKVAIDDNCIYSSKIFKCLGLGEADS